jgi:hypothetical protein
MATISEVKAFLDDISKIIRTERAQMKIAKIRMTNGYNTLNSLPTTFADAIAEIDGYAVDGTIFEQLSKDELSKLTTEFVALRTDANSAISALSSLTEF